MAVATAVTLLALVGLVAATPASAASAASTKAKGCAKQVIDDWYVHRGQKVEIRGHYQLHCYRDAIDSLGSDVTEYTNAKEAIESAAAAEALRCKSNCGPGGPSGPTALPGEGAITYHNTYDFGGNPPPVIDPVPISSSNPSSVPLPLIVLAGLAGVLLLAGAGGYLVRRLKSRGTPPPATDTSS
ncbi:MAG: hypothetical protein ABI927_05620 [Gaiellaceae bacterium]